MMTSRSLMRLLFAPLAVLLLTQSACSQSRMTGELKEGDSTLENGEYYDTYTLEVESGQWIEVDMTTSDFDPYLVVMAPSGHNEQNDDFEGSRERSYLRIQATESGTWQVYATSYEGGETGRYRLSLNVLNDGVQAVCGAVSEDRIDTIKRWFTSKQCLLHWLGQQLVLTVCIAKQRIENNLGITLHHHQAFVGHVLRNCVVAIGIGHNDARCEHQQ